MYICMRFLRVRDEADDDDADEEREDPRRKRSSLVRRNFIIIIIIIILVVVVVFFFAPALLIRSLLFQKDTARSKNVASVAATRCSRTHVTAFFDRFLLISSALRFMFN